jgi:hypothetical protein
MLDPGQTFAWTLTKVRSMATLLSGGKMQKLQVAQCAFYGSRCGSVATPQSGWLRACIPPGGRAAAISDLVNEQQADLRRLLKIPADFVLHTFPHETEADAFTIMKLMGHSKVTVSQRYVHHSPEAMDNAVTQLEAWNRTRSHWVDTNVGVVVFASSANKQLRFCRVRNVGK